VGGTIGADAMVLKCDVTSWEDQVALFKAGYEKYGCIDYVVANAGIGHGGDGSLALTMLPREPSKPSTSVVDVNLTGVIYTTRLAQFYLMKKNKSKEQRALIFIGSMGMYSFLLKQQCILNVISQPETTVGPLHLW
ncbi:hypothetical protein FRC18_008779, partial [Serendipita sp. 400]